MRVRAALPGAGVPDTEALRRAALQASWARDRRVGRRRLLWRWMLWFLLRCVLPAFALACVLVFAWLLMRHLQADGAAAPAAAPAAATASGGANAEAAAPAPLKPVPALRLDLSIPADAPSQSTESMDKTPQPLSTQPQLSTSGDTRP